MRMRAVKSRLISGVATSPALKRALRAMHSARHQLTSAPRVVEYYHQVDDPYCALCAQLLEALVDRHDIALAPKLVSAPPAWATPDRERWLTLSILDAGRLATHLDLDYTPPKAPEPAPDLLLLGQRLLANVQDPGAFTSLAKQVGDALARGARAELDALANTHAPASEDATRALLEANNARRVKKGHYLGATFYYDGEWYWGVDRLHYLEQRLIDEGASSATTPLIMARNEGEATSKEEDARAEGRTLEFFLSLRSPYSYLAMSRTFAMAKRLDLDLHIRPVLPMVMRGLEVPMAKRLYIVRDARREAIRQDIPFGRISDPLGGGIERALSLVPYAREEGKLEEYLVSAGSGIFSDELDVGEDRGLRAVVERAGLSWEVARGWLVQDAWREEVAQNREAMLATGSWGVPTFRVDGEHTFWGQDRLWMVEGALRS